MRILILHSRYRSGSASGENRVVEDEARLLSGGGHEVELFTPSVGKVGALSLVRVAAETVWSRRALEGVARRIRSIRPDIVHIHNLFPSLSPAVLRVLPDRAGVVLTLHNYRLLCLPGTFVRDGRVCEDCLGRLPWPGVIHGCYQGSVPASGVLASSLKLHGAVGTFRRIDLYVAISQFVRAKHLDAGMLPGRILVKPHFAWPSPRREGPGEYFLYLGRLSPEKGVAALLEAWRRIEAKLVVVGDGPERERLWSLAPSNVEFREPVAPRLVPDLLLRARAVMVPSLSHEGAGKVILEAYAAGVPVIASRAGGLPEVVQDGTTGLLLPPGDAAAWVDGVSRLLDDPLSVRMGRAGLSVWRESYEPDKGLAALEAAYAKALQLSRSGRRKMTT